MQKFYRKRYFLFSRFDRGAQLDEEGWYSVTPEIIAKYLAHRTKRAIGKGIVLDAFCGVGGNLCQFGRAGITCVGVDFDTNKCEMTGANATNLYDLKKGQDFHVIESDFLKLRPKHIERVLGSE